MQLLVAAAGEQLKEPQPGQQYNFSRPLADLEPGTLWGEVGWRTVKTRFAKQS